MTDMEYCIEKIDSNNPAHVTAVDRMIEGPIDLTRNIGIPAIEMVVNGNNYRMLTLDTWTNGTCESRVVGYMRFRVINGTKVRVAEVHIDEFEIFREHRGHGYARAFMRAILEYKQYFNMQTALCLVYPASINGSEAFYVHVLGIDYFVADVESRCTLNDTARAQLDLICTERRYGQRMREFMHAVLDALVQADRQTDEFFRENPDKTYFDYMVHVRRTVEFSPAWRRIFRKRV